MLTSRAQSHACLPTEQSGQVLIQGSSSPLRGRSIAEFFLFQNNSGVDAGMIFFRETSIESFT